jgi:hypothetical protein
MNATQDVSPVRAARIDTIKRAISVIDNATHADLAGYLVRTDIHDHLKADPLTLRKGLAFAAAADDTPTIFGAWKAAQQICKAAGLPY